MSTANSQETLGLGKHKPQTINNLWSTKIPGLWQPLPLKSNSTAGEKSSPETRDCVSIATAVPTELPVFSCRVRTTQCTAREGQGGKTGLCSQYPNVFENWNLSSFSIQIGNHYRALAVDPACVCFLWAGSYMHTHAHSTCTHVHTHTHAHTRTHTHYCCFCIESQL